MGGIVLGTVGDSQRISWVLRATDSSKGLGFLDSNMQICHYGCSMV